MKRIPWLFLFSFLSSLTLAGIIAASACSSSTTEGPDPSGGSTSSSSGSGGQGGETSSSSSSTSSSNSSSSASSSGAGGGPFAACTDTTGSLGDCKDCCDCASNLTCQEQRTCRDTCNALGDAYFAMNPNPIPVNAPSTLGPGGDYSACTAAAMTEQECKTCCDCTMNFLCGDHPYCRNACIAKFGDGGAPPPNDGG